MTPGNYSEDEFEEEDDASKNNDAIENSSNDDINNGTSKFG